MHIVKICSDLETPVSLFLKTCAGKEYCFLLESTEKEASFGRYSFIGLGAKEVISLDQQGKVFSAGKEIEFRGMPLQAVYNRLKEYRLNVNDPDLPSFIGGAVGYVGYDYVRFLENIDIKKSKFPCFQFMIPESLIVFDHMKNQIAVISDRPEEIVSDLVQPGVKTRPKKVLTTEPVSNFSREEFYRAVKTIKKHIVEGDIFQAVLSQRFRFRTSLDHFSIYRALRMINPSPYMFFQKFREFSLVGSSPEMMVKLDNQECFLKPIAGTRKRGKTIDEDLSLEKEMLSDEKEKAEHMMLLDLGRNDLGKVCRGGSVAVTEQMSVERFSHVMHMVSKISGRIDQKKNAVDLFESAFPAGTVSGAPKVRAMEIINSLESDSRGPYGGAVVYFSAPCRGSSVCMDSGIMIRSFFFKGQEGFLQAGAGIVYDSVPELEYKEIINKAGALLRSLELAEKIEGGLI